ncbi:MAG: hypothetical protein KGI54_01685 [Pseudomonadota bacterium]|nr:hypothetical protein [Pseudomonadota bacterium]
MARKGKEKIGKKELRKQWESFSAERYKSVMEGLVHLSFKAVNSNATPGGVRLVEKIDLPYISASSLGPDKVGLDYPVMNTSDSKVVTQINVVTDGIEDERFLDVPRDEREFILITRMEMGYLDNTSRLDCHLRQVILPDMEGGDICITPVHVAGVSSVINAIERAMDKAGEFHNEYMQRIKHATMQFGGANPQNVGSRIRDMQSPIYVMPPRENPVAQKVLRIHFNGIQILYNRGIDEFLGLMDGLREKKIGMKERILINKNLRRLTRDILDRSASAMDLLAGNRELLPGEELLDDELMMNELQAGLLMPEKRSASWRDVFSEYVMDRIRHRIRKMDGQDVGSGISIDEAYRMRSFIESEVLA